MREAGIKKPDLQFCMTKAKLIASPRLPSQRQALVGLFKFVDSETVGDKICFRQNHRNRGRSDPARGALLNARTTGWPRLRFFCAHVFYHGARKVVHYGHGNDSGPQGR
jgi:hypothetical protein